MVKKGFYNFSVIWYSVVKHRRNSIPPSMCILLIIIANLFLVTLLGQAKQKENFTQWQFWQSSCDETGEAFLDKLHKKHDLGKDVHRFICFFRLQIDFSLSWRFVSAGCEALSNGKKIESLGIYWRVQVCICLFLVFKIYFQITFTFIFQCFTNPSRNRLFHTLIHTVCTFI